MIDPGDKVLWKGEEHTVVKTYDQPMVQIVDVNDNVQSAPLAGVISETMKTLLSTKKEALRLADLDMPKDLPKPKKRKAK